MAKPLLLQEDFSGGMKPDTPLPQMPKNAVRNMTDFLPGTGEAPLSARDGWTRVGATMATTYAGALAFAPFSAGGQLVGIADTGAVFQVPHTTVGANTARGTAQAPFQQPIFYRNVLYIPSDNGTTSVKSYDGSTNATTAAGAPPAGQLATTFKDHLVLGRDASNVRRIWFANGGDASVWDTAVDGQWLDVTFPLLGLATVRNMILAFSQEGAERVRGDIIPGVTGSDMVKEPLPIPGCGDPGSIAVANDVCYYANATGIYMTDGIGSVDLTTQGGIKNWYGTQLADYSSTWHLAGASYQGTYILVAHDGSTFKFCLVCDVARRAFYQFSNVPTIMFATIPEGYTSQQAGDLYMAERDAPWLVNASGMFKRRSQADDSVAIGTSDGNGVSRSLRLRTGFFKGSEGRKRFKKVYFRIGADAADTFTVKAYTAETLASSITVGTISNPDGRTVPARRKLSLARATEGVALELTSTLSSGGILDLYKIEAEVLPGEQSRG